jgi:hypothetical protein
VPARDVYHEVVKQVLLKDGWKILKEDYELEYGEDSLYPDFAAERSFIAERDTFKNLVEVKSFIGRFPFREASPTFIADLQRAIGQYAMYQTVIEAQGLEFRLYMAIPYTVYAERFQSPLAQLMLEWGGINLGNF